MAGSPTSEGVALDPPVIAPKSSAATLNIVGGLVFIALLATISVVYGLPVKRGWVSVWVIAAVVCFGLGDLRRAANQLASIWVPVLAALWAYDWMRGHADGLASRASLGPHLNFDEWLGWGTVPTERLQSAFYDAGTTHWYDYATWVVYQSHFFVPIAALLVLWRIGSEFFRTYLAAFLLLTFMALGTYFVYPAQPPWMASDRGEIGPVERVVHDVWKNVGVERAANVFASEQPNKAAPKESAYSNKVAALPSLHAAYPMLLVCLAFAVGGFATRRFAVYLSAAYLVAMGAALVYGGEHYVFDILMGWAYAAVAWVVARKLITQRGLRRRNYCRTSR